LNPITLIEAVAERGFLIGFAAGLIAGLMAQFIRIRGVWALATAIAIAAALMLQGSVSGAPQLNVELGVTAVAVVAIGAVGMSQVIEDHGWQVALTCLALTSLGVWGTVPDTENAVVLLGSVVGAVVGGWRLTVGRVHSVTLIPLFAVTALVAITDGTGRPSAPYGALAACGVFLLAPFVRFPTRRWWVLGTHAVLVVFGGRIAGTRPSAGAAAIVGLLGLVVGAAFLGWNGRSTSVESSAT
jgi:hypothetical protein